MAKNTQPVLKRCRTLGVSPAAMGYSKQSNRNPGGKRRTMVAAGGVAANSVIRADLHAACGKAGVRLFLPPLKWCGDNGAMIGAQGYYEYQAGRTAGLDLNAYATMDLGAPLL